MDKTSSTPVSPSQNKIINRDARLEYLWLTYFNDTLYAKGVITEQERNKMRILIKQRSASTIR